MATVYLAREAKHERRVAIKVLHADLAALVGPERFLQEIRITAHLQHPHILGLIDSGVVGPNMGGTLAEGLVGRPYYVMPYVEGLSLRQRLEREGQLPVADAVRIAREIASALGYAHRHDVVHRDIKPENVLLGDDGEALVTDFGIALALQQSAGTRLTQTGLSLGTPAYMSPEQAMAERQITARSDIYALGAILYEMLAGEPPFTGATTQAVVARVMTEAPRSLMSQRPNVGPHLDEAVRRALERLPADRFDSAAAFARAIDSSAASAVPSAAVGLRGAGARPTRRAVGVFAVLAAAAALVAIGLAVGRRWSTQAAAPAAIRATLLPPAGEQFASRDGLAFSPDGTRLAFTLERAAPRPRLFVRTLAFGTVRELSGTGDARFPFWSPDGRSIGFFAEGELRRVPADGGPVTAITRALAPKGGTWAADQTILFAADPGVIYRVSAGGGSAVAVTRRGQEDVHVSPVFLPDGHRFLFSGQWHSGVFLGDLRTGAVRLIRRDASNAAYVPPGYLLFASAGPIGHGRWVMAQPFDLEHGVLEGEATLVSDSLWMSSGVTTYAVSAAGLLVFQTDPGYGHRVWLDRRGAALDSLSPDDAWTFRISHDGRRVAQGGFGLWVRDLRRGVAIKLPTQGSETQAEPVWSPDDERIAYLPWTSAGGYQHIHVARVDGSGEEVPLPSLPNGSTASPMDWSPDGRLLLLAREATASAPQPSLWVYDAGARTVTRWLTTLGRLPHARFSPDGRWVAYESSETGTREVYLRPFPGPGAPVRVSQAGGGLPEWRVDGRELFYLTPGGAIMAAPVASGGLPGIGPARQLVSSVNGADTYDAAPDGQRFLLNTENKERPPLTLLAPWTPTPPTPPR